jgi:Domain of unknown function (DUF4440)
VDAKDEKVALDYEQTVETYRQLADIRFKLLAFVPTLSGVAVALLAGERLDELLRVALGGLGFFVTLGIVLYDQRNTQFYNGAIGRARYLENALDFGAFGTDDHRGLFGSRADHPTRRFFGLPVGHDLGLALIYSAALGGWVFVVADAVELWPNWVALAIGSGFASLAFLQLEWLDGKPKQLRKRFPERRKSMDETTLSSLNDDFADAERSRDESFFRRALAKDLVFRRADGTCVDRDEYLRGLRDENNTYDHLMTEELETIMFDQRTALVSVRVLAKGERDGRSFEGVFRNTRLFVKRRGEWKCAVWFNTREDGTPADDL